MVKRFTILIFVIVLTISLSVEAYATDETIPDEYNELIDSLPDDIAQLLPEGLFSSSADGIERGAKELTSWSFWGENILNIIGFNIAVILRSIAVIASILTASALLKSIYKSFNNEGSSLVLKLLSTTAVSVALIELSREPLERAALLLDRIKLFVNTASPLMCVMYAMGGNVSEALVYNYGLLVFLSIFENVCILALEMILGVCISLTLASTFISDGNLLSLSKAIKNCFTAIVGLIMVIFTAVISTQSLLASKADTVSAKAAKVLASQMIPVVGSTVGESLRTVGASIEYLRSSVGVVLIVIFLLTVIPTILSIFCYRIAFTVSNALAGLLGCESEGGVILEISGMYGYALAILCISSVALLLLLAVFAKSASPLT